MFLAPVDQTNRVEFTLATSTRLKEKYLRFYILLEVDNDSDHE